MVDRSGKGRLYFTAGDFTGHGKGVIYTYDSDAPEKGECTPARYNDPVKGRKHPGIAEVSGGRYMLVGGDVPTDDFKGGKNTAMIFDPGDDAVDGTFEEANPTKFPREACSAFSLENGEKALAILGRDRENKLINHTEIYDVAEDSWEDASPLNVARSRFAYATMLDGRILISGGTDESGNALDSMEIFDPCTGEWEFMEGAMRYPRAAHRACVLESGEVLLFGGCDTRNVAVGESEIFRP